jgi:hypothetical protein
MFRRLSLLIAVLALALGACSTAAPAGPALTDPKDILAKTVVALKDAMSFHVRGDLNGSIKLDLMGTGGATPLELKGTTLEGDIDIANKKLHLSFAAPAILSLAGDVIAIDQTTWVKVNLPGSTPKYQKSTSDSTAPTNPQEWVDEVNKFLNTPGVAPTKQPDEKCGDLDCYLVRLPLTSAQLGGVIPGGLESAAPSASGTIDVWVRKNDLRPAKINVTADAGDMGSVTVTIVFSAYDAAITVNPPPASEVAAETPAPY